jgi:uncharacterized protein (DUF433 family)
MAKTSSGESDVRTNPNDPPVARHPDFCGGDARIRGTRIPVWVLVGCRRAGLSDDAILADYPQLTRADLAAAWEYAAAHPEEIERAIRENEEGAEGFVG